MKEQIKILILEDSVADAELVEHRLRKDGIDFISKRLETREDFVRELKDFEPDVILSDYSLPNFDGMEALTIVKKRRLDIPFIIVTGSLGEELTVKLLKEGMTDYILKDKLARLGPSVRRALIEVKEQNEYKKSEELLRTSEKKYRELVANSLVGVYQCNLQGDIIFANEALAQLLEYGTPEEFMGINAVRCYKNPEVRAKLVAELKRTGMVSNFEAELVSRTGLVKHVLISATFDGRIISGMMLDITERKKAEQLFKESEERFRAVFDTANDGILVASTDDKKFYLANKAICKMLGYSPDEIKKLGVADIHPKEDLSYAMNQFEKQLRGEIDVAEGLPVKRKDGTVFYVDINASSLKLGNKEYLMGLFRDITERKKIEESLRVSEQQWRSTFDTISDVVCILDIAGKTLRCNKAITNIIKKPYNEIVGRPCWENFHGTSGRIKECPFERMRQTLRRETTITQIDNKWYEITVDPLLDDAGNLNGAVHIMSDITERKKLEEQLFRSQKMEAIGTLAGGVAHDFNNILTVIQGYTEMALMDMSKNDPLFNNMESINQASQRAADLTRQLLIFGRKKYMELSDLDINRTIIDLLKMLTRLIGEDITITTDLVSDGWGIKADKSNIEQVIMNLVVNARDAMPKGGDITIKTENVVIDEDYCRTNTEATPGQFVRLSITDTGIGMDKEIMKHLFEPFFSTKEINKGGGLGLSVVYGIVKQHQGWINVYSEPAHGTIFTIYLPAIIGQIEKKTEKSITIDTPEGNGERILLVEDEAPVREFGIAVLEKHNYVVFAAATAQEAKQLFEREKGKFHLIFSDTILPDSNGLELVNQLRVYNPELPVLMCSGYSNEKIHKAILQEKQVPFLQKPYSIIDMLKVVKETIEGQPR